MPAEVLLIAKQVMIYSMSKLPDASSDNEGHCAVPWLHASLLSDAS